MAIDNNSGIDGLGSSGPLGDDPAAKSPLDQLMEAIDKLIEEMKSGKPVDHSEQMSMIMQKMNAISGGVVSADTQTMTAMDRYDAASSNMQEALQDSKQGDTSVPLINPYTGKPRSDGKTGTPEEAIAADAQFLKNDGNQKYQLNESGQVVKGADGKPLLNRAYQFFHANNDKNKGLFDSIGTNVDSIMKGINPDYDSKGTPDTNYPSGYPGKSYSIPKGQIYNHLWQPVIAPTAGSGGAAGKPDSTALQAVQSAHASLVQSLGSNTAAVQSLAKQDSTNYQSNTSALTKFEQSWLTIMKACQSGIKSA